MLSHILDSFLKTCFQIDSIDAQPGYAGEPFPYANFVTFFHFLSASIVVDEEVGSDVPPTGDW